MIPYVNFIHNIYYGHNNAYCLVSNKNKICVAKILYYKNNYYNELKLLKKLKHKNIIKFLGQGICEISNIYYYTLLYEKKNYSIKYMIDNNIYIQGYKLISSIIDVVNYLIDNNIIHRNIKFSNILCSNNNDTQNFKLSDFSNAIKYKKNIDKIYLKKYCNYIKLTASECKYKLIENNFITDKYHDMYSIAYIIYKLLLLNNISINYLSEDQFNIFIDNYYYIINNNRESIHNIKIEN